MCLEYIVTFASVLELISFWASSRITWLYYKKINSLSSKTICSSSQTAGTWEIKAFFFTAIKTQIKLIMPLLRTHSNNCGSCGSPITRYGNNNIYSPGARKHFLQSRTLAATSRVIM